MVEQYKMQNPPKEKRSAGLLFAFSQTEI